MIHLHTRSHYSLLSSTLSIQQIVALAKKNQMRAIALTDEDVLFAAVPFFDLCKENHIQPLIGLDKIIEQMAMILLARNDFGYQELMRISQKEVTLHEIDFKDLVVILYPKDTILKQYLIENNIQAIHTLLQQYKHIPYFYIGISNTLHSIDMQYNQLLRKIAMQNQMETVALSYILYEKKEDTHTLDLLTAIKLGYTIDDHRLPAYQNRYFRTQKEMEQLYTKQELENTEKIANLCNLTLQLPKTSLPKYCDDSKIFLRNLCQKGLFKRCNGNILKHYQERLDYELSIILKMDFEDYFLAVWDIVLYCNRHDIYVGPGRGSAAGSLVAYCLGITKLDPIQYQITFERFLNPERITMPDIDLDFPDDKREQVLSYIKEKYGTSKVANIVVFNTLKAKAAIRDVARVLKMDTLDIDFVIRLFKDENTDIQSLLKQNDKLKQLYLKNQKMKQLLDAAMRIENFPRHTSIHASGIVVSSDNIEKYAPTLQLEDGYTTQYSMHFLERFGLIKIDILGLKNLSIISDTIHHIEKYYHKKLNILQIPLNDKKTFELLQKDETLGIFQLESDGMRQLLKKLKPTCLEDIALCLALYRPGPMKHIPMFLEKRNNASLVSYYCEEVKPILQETFGIMVYQDQIMQVAQVMANFSLGKADILRRAMGKKDASIFEQLKQDFYDGCTQNGYALNLIEQVFTDMESFAGYGFNKAHTISYALLSYQMAFLKANTPTLFYTSLLNSVVGNYPKTYQYLQEAKRNYVYVRQPHLAYSDITYVIVDRHIYMPFTAIKNIGHVAAKTIVSNRTTFKNIVDVILFSLQNQISRKVVECLIHAGAMDYLGMNRTMIMRYLDILYQYCQLILVKTKDGKYEVAYHVVSEPKLEFVKENTLEICVQEKELLGFYFSNHPIAAVRNKYKLSVYLKDLLPQKYQTIIVIIDKMKVHQTKKGDKMCFLVVNDELSQMDVVCMPKQYAQYASILKVQQMYRMVVKKDKENSAILQQMYVID